jgi:3-methyladenine DNA glycosylase AlkD
VATSSKRPKTTAATVRTALRQHSDALRAAAVRRFFKCGPGEYGEDDAFIGVTVPAQRAIARRYRDLPLDEAEKLLTSRVHEDRLTALLILVDQFVRAAGSLAERTADANRQAGSQLRKEIFAVYMKRLRFINNWDLVDSSAPHIVGGWLADKPRGLLDRLARSKHLWSRRVAMLSTFHYIRQGDCRDAIRIATILLHDRHDLIHKAVGWMLRETGKRASAPALDEFLRRHAATMPRTMLRYAIERFTAAERTRYLSARTRHASVPLPGP